MTWTTSRNNHINGASGNDRARQTLVLLKDLLKAATVPWTVVGTGTGTGGSYDMAGTDLLPSFPSITGVNDLAWFCLENAGGAQIVVQVSGTNFVFSWAAQGGFEIGLPASDADVDTTPGSSNNPATYVYQAPSNDDVGQNAAHYKSVAVDDSGLSFIMFGINGVNNAFNLCFLKMNADAADTEPYLGFFSCAQNDTPWDMSTWQSSSNAGTRRCFHPGAGAGIEYLIADPNAGNTYFMDDMPADPYAGKQQTLGMIAVSITAPYKHVKGGLPGILRVPGNRSTGDTLEGGDLMVIGEMGVPWGSAVDPLL